LLPDQVVEVIDHHPKLDDSLFKNAIIQIEPVGAAATLVAERFVSAEIVPSKESALLLYAGILSNTQNYMQSTDRDKAMGAWLKEISGAPDDLGRQLFRAKSDLSGSKLAKHLSTDTKIFTIQGKKIGTTQLEIIDVKKFIESRRSEIENALQMIKQDDQCGYTFANMQDLEIVVSYILCADQETFDLLQTMPGVTWDGWLGESKKLTLRKQITAWIDEHLKCV
jgi:manganese-dependent inorganic pyrophosphatase